METMTKKEKKKLMKLISEAVNKTLLEEQANPYAALEAALRERRPLSLELARMLERIASEYTEAQRQRSLAAMGKLTRPSPEQSRQVRKTLPIADWEGNIRNVPAPNLQLTPSEE